jgi:hypothetical protein
MSVLPSPQGSQDPLAHLSPQEQNLLAGFLLLVRDNYKKADKASYFLERRAGVVNTCAMTNLRDVLSHLATFLDVTTPAHKREAQLASAEEHLRRAILEPYEIGLATLTEKFTSNYDRYRETLLPVKDVIVGFGGAPNRLLVDSRVEEVNALALKGKQAKGRNIWDDDWEDGVASFADAYEKLFALHAEIEDWLFKHNQYQSSKVQIKLGRWGIFWTLLAFLLTLIATYLVGRYFAPV